MNPGEIITTEINTEIKVEVQLETASIVKVETSKAGCNNKSVIIGNSTKAIEMSGNQEAEKEKTREEIKAEREAKKLAKQAKKLKAIGGNAPNADAIVSNNSNSPKESTTNKAEQLVANNVTAVATATTNSEEAEEKTREQIKAEREAKKLAKQAAKAAKSGAVAVGNAAVCYRCTQQLNQVKLNETQAKAANNEAGNVGEQGGEKVKFLKIQH